MIWYSDIETFAKFEKLIKQDRELVFLTATHAGREIGLTAASLMEEHQFCLIVGPREMWRASARAEGRRWHLAKTKAGPRETGSPRPSLAGRRSSKR
jgi:hypothetical protein